MAKCRTCGTDIPEGMEYCEACLGKLNTADDSESYLDSLLSAVMTDEPERREVVYPKKDTSSLVSVSEEPEEQNAVSGSEPESILAETPEETSEEDVWDDFMKEFLTPPETEEDRVASLFDEAVPEAESDEAEPAWFGEEAEAESTEEAQELFEDEPEEAPMEGVFGTFFDGEQDLPDLSSYSIFDDVDEGTVDRMLADDLMEDTREEESSYDAFPDLFGEEAPLPEFGSDESTLGLEDMEDLPEFGADESPAELADAEELFGFGEDSPMEFVTSDALFGEDAGPAEFGATEDLPEFGAEEEIEEEVPVTEFSDVEDLFGMLQDEKGADAPEEPVIAEGAVISAAEFDMNSDSFSGVVEEEVSATEFGDFSDLFSDLGDDSGGMFEFGAEPEVMDEPEETSVAEPSQGVRKTAEPQIEGKKAKKEAKEPGRFSVLFHKLFDDVKVDPSKIKKPLTPEELAAQKKAKQEEKERSKEEKEALLAEKKEQEKQVRQEKQRVKKEAKAQKKAKKMEEAKLLLEEIQRTRINRAGASIIFLFFIMIAVFIVVGTNIFSYSIGIRNAERNFKKQKYTEAYNEIYGLDVKDEDIVLYDRIMTVMYVQKQLNSYDNYIRNNDRPNALDSLLKGLVRYEKYIELAIELDVDSDLDFVRGKILIEMEKEFELTEQEAMEIIQSDSRIEYSKRVYDVAEELESE